MSKDPKTLNPEPERIKACAKIKGFWVNTMLNHPSLKDHVGQNDEECLMHLNEVDVQEIDDDTFQVLSQALTLVSVLRAADSAEGSRHRWASC